MKPHFLVLSILLAGFACSCSSIEKPKGNSRGYKSARLLKSSGATTPQGIEDSPVVNQMVIDAISSEFSKNGIPVSDAGNDLVIAYMLIHQNTSSTTMNSDHFGYGRDPEAILEKAHERGVIDNKSPEAFEAGAILIDVIDSRTNDLVFRNFAKRSMVEGTTDAARKLRIESAVAEALKPFFK